VNIDTPQWHTMQHVCRAKLLILLESARGIASAAIFRMKPTQTELLDQLREMLQSIAITAVAIQDKQGNPDAVDDAISDIQSDLNHCQRINNLLRKG
jgi:hypothetical protein